MEKKNDIASPPLPSPLRRGPAPRDRLRPGRAAPGPRGGGGDRDPRSGAPQRHYRRGGREGGSPDDRRREESPHRRHCDPSPRRQSLSGQGPGRLRRRQRLWQVHGLDPDRGAGRNRGSDPPHQHALRPRGRGRRDRLDPAPERQRDGAVGQCRGRRDERRRPQRHTRPPGDQGGRARRHRRRPGGPVAEGSVGAGTGTIAFGWKGGIGTTRRSRRSSAAGR